MGLPAAGHDAASYSTGNVGSLARCCFALLARTCETKDNSGADSVMGSLPTLSTTPPDAKPVTKDYFG